MPTSGVALSHLVLATSPNGLGPNPVCGGRPHMCGGARRTLTGGRTRRVAGRAPDD